MKKTRSQKIQRSFFLFRPTNEGRGGGGVIRQIAHIQTFIILYLRLQNNFFVCDT